MAYIVTRTRKTGTRFTVYSSELNGRKVSLGTFSTRQQAEQVRKQAQESMLLESTGCVTIEAARSAARSLQDYFYDEEATGYRARTNISPATWLHYETIMRLHVLPVLGPRAVKDIRREDVRLLVRDLHARGTGAATIDRCRKVLSAVYSTLLDHDVVRVNPAYRVRTPPVRRVEKPICTPQEVQRLLAALPAEGARLFATFLIETGTRFGEATEVRPTDFDWRHGTIQVTRAVADIGDEANPEGTGRFLIKTTKSGRGRFVTISPSLLEQLQLFMARHSIAPTDLLFPERLVVPPRTSPPRPPEIELTPDLIDSLGLTPPNSKGYRYRHGTISGYSSGCRCDYCRQASREYHRSRRAPRGRDQGSRRRTNLTGHLPRDAWAKIWQVACSDAELGFTMGTHSLRHTHATWLLKNGVDLHTVKERLGHASITTTEMYLHRINAEDPTTSNVIAGLLS